MNPTADEEVKLYFHNSDDHSDGIMRTEPGMHENLPANKVEGEWMVKAYINGTNVFGTFPVRTYTIRIRARTQSISTITKEDFGILM